MSTKALRLVNGIPRSTLAAVEDFYEQTYTAVGLVTSGTAITLPSSGTYTDQDLLVYLNNIPQETVLDYNYVGSAPRTQITFTFDLRAGDRVRFKKLLKK